MRPVAPQSLETLDEKNTRLLGIAAFGMAACASVNAQAYPERPITIIVPFAAGGPTDMSARLVANQMSREPGFTVVIENAPGAGAVIGASKGARAAPDGYTLLWGSASSLAMAPHLYPDIKYNPLTSFAPVGLVASQPFVLVAKPALGVKSIGDFVAKAKAAPGGMNYASTGRGASAHLVTELFQMAADVTATHIPYNGGAPAMNALLAGDVDFLFDTTTTTVPMALNKRVTAIGVAGDKRWAQLPDVPTFKEAGYKDFEASTWFGLLAPAGTPEAHVRLLNDRLNKAIKSPEVSAALEKAGFIIEGSTPEGFAKRIAADVARWGGTIKKANVKLD